MTRTRNALLGSLIACVALLIAPTGAGAAQGSGNPALVVTPVTLQQGRSTTVTVTGRDYLVPPHAPGVSVFGGVYVFFGWVQPGSGWGPSARNSNNNAGVFGVTYSYRGDGGDASTRDDGSGTVRLVSFTAGGESGNATDFHMDDNGNWNTTLNIPNVTYQYDDVNGVKRTTDCRNVQCGVFTIGVHGKSSATNERFTPITFTAPPTPTTHPTSQGGTTPTTKPRPTPTTAPSGGGEPNAPDPTVVGSAGPTTATSVVVGTGSTTVPKSQTSTTATKRTTTTTGGGLTSTAAPAPANVGEAVAIEPTSSTGGDGGSPWLWIVFGLVPLVVIGGGAGLWLRRRSGAANMPK